MILNIYIVTRTFKDAPTMISGLRDLSSDWKIILFLTAPLMYRPIRKVADEIIEFGGIKRVPKADQYVQQTQSTMEAGEYSEGPHSKRT